MDKFLFCKDLKNRTINIISFFVDYIEDNCAIAFSNRLIYIKVNVCFNVCKKLRVANESKLENKQMYTLSAGFTL